MTAMNVRPRVPSTTPGKRVVTTGRARGQVARMCWRSRSSRAMFTATSTRTRAGLRTLFEYQKMAIGVMIDEKPYPTAPFVTAAPKATIASQMLLQRSIGVH